MEIRLPNISAQTLPEQMSQMRSYIYQFASELQWALDQIEKKADSNTEAIEAAGNPTPEEAEKKAKDNFTSVKSLIIKSADIVNAYYDQMNERFKGEYVAESDFGTFREETEAEITKNANGIQSLFANVQTISGGLEEMRTLITNAYIRQGLLYYKDDGTAVYGLEVGQTNRQPDGVVTFKKFARFIPDRLSFYDSNDTEVAYISDYKLYITNAHVRGNLTVGSFMVDTTRGFAIKWIGG